MRKILTFLLFICVYSIINAQDEQLSSLKFNPRLYYKNHERSLAGFGSKYLVQEGIYAVITDTLTLPFVDDFSHNNLRQAGWLPNNIDTTYYNIIASCLVTEGFPNTVVIYSPDTVWNYFFDTLTQQYDDSTPQNAFAVNSFNTTAADCFSQLPATVYYWTYQNFFYNTLGQLVDSTLARDTLHFAYTPEIHIAHNQRGTLWADGYAYVNNTYPVNPPTIGVATLDGLNEYGQPYNNSNTGTYGFADALTSKPIDLSGVTGADSVYLSFFYEAQGLGDYPDILDSLIVEFKDEGGLWNYVWTDTGFHAPLNNQQFVEALISVPDIPQPNRYYHSTFQFRFRNKASLYGNNDHWHIDYVKLDRNRSAADTVFHDIAFMYDFPTVLKNFTQMPADQFRYPSDLRDTMTLTVHNMDPNAVSNPPATNFTRGASELYPTPLIVSADTLETFNASTYDYISISPRHQYPIPNSWPVDSLVLTSRVFIDPHDSRPENDTLFHTQNLNYVMAYDDGSAERVYGLTGLGLKKFGYEFNLNYPDTLSGFQIMFGQVEGNIGDLVFNFYAWDSLKMNDINFFDSPIFELDNKVPLYIDSVNGFATYKLDTPIIIPNKIYFGWAQTDPRRLQIGYDLNSTLGRPHMFIFTNGTWKPSTISPDGSPMIRLILDDNFWGTSSATAVIDLRKDEEKISFFPNPSAGLISIKGDRKNTVYEISVMNVLGQLMKVENNVSAHFSVADLSNGMYLLSARDLQTGKVFHGKVIKSGY